MDRELKSAVFVCYDDIVPSDSAYGFNPVVYNPILKEEEKRDFARRVPTDLT
jgi:hypothetical protein